MDDNLTIHAYNSESGDSFPIGTFGSCVQFRYRSNDHVADINEAIKEINDYFKTVTDYLKCDVNAHDWAEPIIRALAIYRYDLHSDKMINHLTEVMNHQILVDDIIHDAIAMLRKKYYVVVW